MQNEEKLHNGVATAEELEFMKATGKLRYRLTNDYLFHVVMQRNEKVLRGLIASLLGMSKKDVVKVEVRNPITPGQVIGDKEVILDLKVVLNDKSMLNIEMQVARRDD